ncbi:MAG: hypothetical protein AAF802_22975 [Planctomycetota bacterium]
MFAKLRYRPLPRNERIQVIDGSKENASSDGKCDDGHGQRQLSAVKT